MADQRLGEPRARGLALLAAGAASLLPVAWAAPPEDLVTRQAIIRQLTAPKADEKGLVIVEDAAPGEGQHPAQVEQARSIDLPNIEFGLGSSELTPAARAQLDELAAALASDDLRGFRFQVAGHTDARGSRAYNQALSERRAAAVRDYLVHSAHMDPRRLEAVGRGTDAPRGVDPYSAENRRVEIRNLGEKR